MSTYVTKRAKELGLKKIEAKKPLKIELLQKDIDKAERKNSKCCAFACATMRTYPVKAAYFFRSSAWLEYADKLVRYSLPPSVQKEIVSFDRSKIMAPGIYQLSAVTKTRTSKGRAAYAKAVDQRKRHDRGNGAKRKILHRTTGVRSMFEPRA